MKRSQHHYRCSLESKAVRPSLLDPWQAKRVVKVKNAFTHLTSQTSQPNLAHLKCAQSTYISLQLIILFHPKSSCLPLISRSRRHKGGFRRHDRMQNHKIKYSKNTGSTVHSRWQSPTFPAPRTGFLEHSFSMAWGGGDGFRVIQAHHSEAHFLLCSPVPNSPGIRTVLHPEAGDSCSKASVVDLVIHGWLGAEAALTAQHPGGLSLHMSLALEMIKIKNLKYSSYSIDITFAPQRSWKTISWITVHQTFLSLAQAVVIRAMQVTSQCDAAPPHTPPPNGWERQDTCPGAEMQQADCSAVLGECKTMRPL